MSNLAWQAAVDRRAEAAASVCVGDIVRTGENFHPHYRVIAVCDDRAWVRDVQHGSDHVVPYARCRKV